MARTVDPVAHALRREEFLDAAQRLVQTKGYEQMSVQEVLDELGTSKGAFYHYFGSKQELLWAVVERMADAVASHLQPVTDDPKLPAGDKLQQFFAALASWKAQRRDLLVPVLRVWYSDSNALVRQRLRAGIADRIAPLLGSIIVQGIQEGVFAPSAPDQLGRLLIALIQDLNDRLAELFFAFESGASDLDEVTHTAAAYTHALERILGLPQGSVVLAEPATLAAWFDPDDKRNGAS